MAKAITKRIFRQTTKTKIAVMRYESVQGAKNIRELDESMKTYYNWVHEYAVAKGAPPESEEKKAALDLVIKDVLTDESDPKFKVKYIQWEENNGGFKELQDIIKDTIIDLEKETPAKQSKNGTESTAGKGKKEAMLNAMTTGWEGNHKEETRTTEDKPEEEPELKQMTKEEGVTEPKIYCTECVDDPYGIWPGIHVIQDLDSNAHQKEPGRCIEFRERGTCSRMGSCRFKHIPADNEQCNDSDYLQYGFCSKHFDCPHRHTYDRIRFGPRQTALDNYLAMRRGRNGSGNRN